MLIHLLASSLLIGFVLLVRILFRKKVPYRLLYLLWIPVFVRLIVPGTVYDFTLSSAEQPAIFDNAFEWLSENTAPSEKPTPPSADEAVDVPPLQTSRSISVKTIFACVYLCGCSVAGGYFCLLSFSVRRKLCRSRQFLQKYRGIRVYSTNRTLAPCVYGLIPAVYLTKGMAPEQRAWVLEHEYTHIRHFDFLRSMLRRLVLVLYWWNPLVWLYVRFAAEDAELACDEAVASELDADARLRYANTIYALLPQNRGGALGFVGKPLKRRLFALTSRSSVRVWAAVLAVVLVLSVSALCSLGLSVEVIHAEAPEPNTDGDWCCELFPADFPVPLYDEIYEVVQDRNTVTVTLFSERGPVSDYLPKHNLRARLLKAGYVNFYDYETRREYFLNREGYNVSIYDHLNAIWLSEAHRKNPYGYTYQIKLEKLSHSFESVFWQYPYKKTDLGLEPIVFEEYPTEYLPSQFPAPPDELSLQLTHAEQQSNGIFLRYEGDLYDFWRYNRLISDAGFYFIETGGEDFFFVNAEGDYLFARIISMSTVGRGHDVFEYQICKKNSLIKK